MLLDEIMASELKPLTTNQPRLHARPVGTIVSGKETFNEYGGYVTATAREKQDISEKAQISGVSATAKIIYPEVFVVSLAAFHLFTFALQNQAAVSGATRDACAVEIFEQRDGVLA